MNDDILKAMGIAISVGTEKSAQKMYADFLKPFGFTDVQSFTPNWKVGTDRVSDGANKKGTILATLFNPRFVTYTYYAMENNIPLYTRTRGEINSELSVWGGVVGMYDVAGSRFPTSNPKKNKVQRMTNGKSTAKEIMRAHNILQRKGDIFDGKMPPSNWESNLSTEQQEDFLEENYPEYHRYLIENLHQPIEANNFLEELKVTVGRAAFVTKVYELIKVKYPDLKDRVFDEATKVDNNKWQIVVIANPNAKADVTNRGFVTLDNEYLTQLMNDKSGKVSDYIKSALTQINSKAGTLVGENSEYFIRAPGGESIEPIVKSGWLNTLRGKNMFDDIKKSTVPSWYDVLKFKGPFDDKEDARDKDNKDKLPAGGGPNKTPDKKDKDSSESGRIYEDANPKGWKDDWKKERGIDKVTGKRTSVSDMQREAEMVGTDSPCCAEIRQYIKDFVTLTIRPNPIVAKQIEDWIDSNIECKDIEEAMSTEHYVDSDDMQAMSTITGQDDKTNAVRGTGKYADGFLIPVEFSDYEAQDIVDNPKKIMVEANTLNFFAMVAGKLSFLPKKKWAIIDSNQSRRSNAPRGEGYSLGMHYHECISGRQKSSKTEASELDNKDFYRDMANTTKEKIAEEEEIKDAYQLRGGVLLPGGRPNWAKDKKKYPDLFTRWTQLSLISPKDEEGYITEDEMTDNEKARERVWDYIDEMSGKETSQEERQARRKDNPLDDYEYYSKEEEEANE